jgi:hypothetical protein
MLSCFKAVLEKSFPENRCRGQMITLRQNASVGCIIFNKSSRFLGYPRMPMFWSLCVWDLLLNREAIASGREWCSSDLMLTKCTTEEHYLRKISVSISKMKWLFLNQYYTSRHSECEQTEWCPIKGTVAAYMCIYRDKPIYTRVSSLMPGSYCLYPYNGVYTGIILFIPV